MIDGKSGNFSLTASSVKTHQGLAAVPRRVRGSVTGSGTWVPSHGMGGNGPNKAGLLGQEYERQNSAVVSVEVLELTFCVAVWPQARPLTPLGLSFPN